MEIFNALMAGFAAAITPVNLLWCLVGCALGTAVGVLPGIGPAVAVAMLLPITGKVDITASMIFFSGIYYGAMYGGSTTSILLNTPGETASMVTAMEGNKMAKSGRAGAALATAAIGSFVAGTIATVVVTLFAPFVADFAVKLGPPEYFLLMLLAFTTVSAVLGKSTLRGMTALFVGLAAGCIGLDQISGQGRYTGGKDRVGHKIKQTHLVGIRKLRGSPADPEPRLQQEPAGADCDNADDPGRKEGWRCKPGRACEDDQQDTVENADGIMADPAQSELVLIGLSLADVLVKDFSRAKMPEPAPDRRPVRPRLNGQQEQQEGPQIHEHRAAHADRHTTPEDIEHGLGFLLVG